VTETYALGRVNDDNRAGGEQSSDETLQAEATSAQLRHKTSDEFSPRANLTPAIAARQEVFRSALL
jgi:hypothetical protein